MTSDESFSEIYRQTHFNSGNFLLGLISGYFALTVLETNKWLTKKSTLILSFITYIVLSFALKSFMMQEKVEVTMFTSIMGAYLKFHHGIFLSLFICGFVFNMNWRSFCHKMFGIADKMFSSTLLASIFISKFLIFDTNELIELTFLKVVRLRCILLR